MASSLRPSGTRSSPLGRPSRQAGSFEAASRPCCAGRRCDNLGEFSGRVKLARKLARARLAPTHCPVQGPFASTEATSEVGNLMTTDYEVTYIVRPALEETEVDARVEQLAELLKNNGGEVVGEI